MFRGQQQVSGGPPLLTTAIIADNEDAWLTVDYGGRNPLGVFEARKALGFSATRLCVRLATPEPEPELRLLLGDRTADQEISCTLTARFGRGARLDPLAASSFRPAVPTRCSSQLC